MKRLVMMLVTFSLSLPVTATNDKTKPQGETKATLPAEEHKDGDGHDHDEGEEEGEKGSVGPDKGITEFSELAGFKLSPEALKNFDLKYQNLTGDGPWVLPKSALVHSGEEVNVFRRRAGFFKRVDIQTLKQTPQDLTLDSDDLRQGDEIVVSGTGFLRIAELAASGGVSHGHSH